MTWPFGELRPLGYQAILVDPPWQYELYSEKGEAKAPQAHYACMPLAAIKALPVGHLARRDTLLIMWATGAMLPHAIDTLAAWSFRYVTAGAWAKQTKRGRKAFGTGYVLRSAAEFFLVGAVGAPAYRSRSVRNLIIARVREHSRKPERMYAMIEELIDGPYVELFARAPRRGWDSWGNETEKFGGGQSS